MEQGLSKSHHAWHIRHLEHYLGQHPLSEALNADHALAYIARLNKEPWQLDQIRKAIDILFQSHHTPCPAGFWRVQATDDIQINKTALPEDPDERIILQQIRVKHYTLATERTYMLYWKRLVYFAQGRPTAQDALQYLTDMAAQKQLSPNTQKIALNSFAFCWKAVYGKQLPRLDFIHATKKTKSPHRTLITRNRNIAQSHSPSAKFIAYFIIIWRWSAYGRMPTFAHQRYRSRQ